MYEINAYPAWYIVSQSSLLILIGAFCLVWGIYSSQRSRRLQAFSIIIATLLIVLAIGIHFPAIRDLTPLWLWRFGGEGILYCLAALLLIGVAWGDKRKTVKHRAMIAVSCLGFAALSFFASGAFVWRWITPVVHENYPDETGVLIQTSGVTCAAASASMLLYRYGFRASEGTMAELANTTPLMGTDAYTLANAINKLVAGKGLEVVLKSLEKNELKTLNCPFYAKVHRPGVGWHAILVEDITDDRLSLIDPLMGNREKLSLTDFEKEWSGLAIWIENKVQ